MRKYKPHCALKACQPDNGNAYRCHLKKFSRIESVTVQDARGDCNQSTVEYKTEDYPRAVGFIDSHCYIFDVNSAQRPRVNGAVRRSVPQGDGWGLMPCLQNPLRLNMATSQNRSIPEREKTSEPSGILERVQWMRLSPYIFMPEAGRHIPPLRGFVRGPGCDAIHIPPLRG